MDQKEKREEARHTKRALMASESFRENRDMVDALLEDGREYTLREARELIETFRKGKVISC